MTTVYVDASCAALTFDTWLVLDEEECWRAVLELMVELGPEAALELLTADVKPAPAKRKGKRT
jgi:hypothetical protein